MCQMGPKVFLNCAGFIKIDTASLTDSTAFYINVLDGSRVHPEAYGLALKMAVDALEHDELAADALDKILENPEPLKHLNLGGYAEELEREGYGKKVITVFNIRTELRCRYKDLRVPYKVPDTEQVFEMLTKEIPQTFYIGKLVTSVVTGIVRQRPHGKPRYDQVIRNGSTGLWHCPMCQRDNFPELSHVWDHVHSSCPGQAIGVRTRLNNGIEGFIRTHFLSDKVVKHPEERVKVGMTVCGRIWKIDMDRLELTCRSSDLKDKSNTWKPHKDRYYDSDMETEEQKKDNQQLRKKAQEKSDCAVNLHTDLHNNFDMFQGVVTRLW